MAHRLPVALNCRRPFALKTLVFRKGSVHKRSSVTIESMYSAQLLDHFQNPRNAGDLPDADATVEIENPVCGDVLRLSLKLDAGRISAIKFKAKGCVPAMACGSALTELALGKTPAEACSLSREDMTEAVGGLPQASSHAAQLALYALCAALAQVSTIQH